MGTPGNGGGGGSSVRSVGLPELHLHGGAERPPSDVSKHQQQKQQKKQQKHQQQQQPPQQRRTRHPWELDVEDLLLGDVIGSGSHGVVYRGQYKNGAVAVKTLLAIDDADSEEACVLLWCVSSACDFFCECEGRP